MEFLLREALIPKAAVEAELASLRATIAELQRQRQRLATPIPDENPSHFRRELAFALGGSTTPESSRSGICTSSTFLI